MHLKTLIISFSVILVLSCKKNCDNTIYCDPIPAKYAAMTKYVTGDEIRFVNNRNEYLNFFVTSGTSTEQSPQDCFYDETRKDCQCPTCYHRWGYFSILDDSTKWRSTGSPFYKVSNELWYYIDDYSKGNFSDLRVEFKVFDYYRQGVNSIQFLPMTLDTNDRFIDSITFGNTTYYDVIESEADLTQSANPLIWKVYFNMSHGLFAFYDLTSNSVFYRN